MGKVTTKKQPAPVVKKLKKVKNHGAVVGAFANRNKSKSAILKTKNLNAKKVVSKKMTMEEILGATHVGTMETAETHKIVTGKFKNWQGVIVERGADETLVKFALWKNCRNKTCRRLFVVELEACALRELGVDDMLENLQGVAQEGEDPNLVRHERETWNCVKCGARNSNEGSFCTALKADGERCMGTPSSTVAAGGWAGCFMQQVLQNQALENIHTIACNSCGIKNDLGSTKCFLCNGVMFGSN